MNCMGFLVPRCFNDFYPTAVKGFVGIVFIHGVRLGRAMGGGKKSCLGYISNQDVKNVRSCHLVETLLWGVCV